MKTSRFFVLVVVVILSIYLGESQAQEKFPNRTIEIVTPWGTGGSSDITARIYSGVLARILNVSVIVINKPGGTGVHGTAYVAKAKKDGYTLLSGPPTSINLVPLVSQVPYDPLKDIFPLVHFAAVPTIFTVRSDSPFKTLDDLVEYARKNPGKLKNCLGGLMTESHLNVEILCLKNNIKIANIPFKGGGQAMLAILGGHVDFSSNSTATSAQHIKGGKLRALAVSSKTRDPDFPDVPTTAESGYPYMSFVVRFGVYAPAGLPQPTLDVLISAFEKTFKDPDVVHRCRMGAAAIVDYKGPEEFRKLIESEMKIYEKVLKDANLIKK